MTKPPQWHPGRLRRSIPIIGEPQSPARKKIVEILLKPFIAENSDVKPEEANRLITDYLNLKV